MEDYEFNGKTMKSPLMTFLSMMENSKANRIPRTFGLAHRKKFDEINVRSFYIPKEYIDPLAKGIDLSKNLRKLDLARTQLSQDSIKKIIDSIPFEMKELNLSFNQNFGLEGSEELCEVILEDIRYRLESLVLEDCKIGDDGIARFGEIFKINDRLRFLDLSNNGITEVGATAFCENFSECYLRVLFMHWNPLGSAGGAAFARAMQVNRDIQILDLSFCGMG